MERVKIVIADEIVERFVLLLEMARDTQFAIGDLLIQQVEQHDNKAEVISYLAGQLNVSASTLYDYYRVAEKWSPAMREIYQSLDWTIYRNSDPSDPNDIELLDRAIDESWNATKFKEEKYNTPRDIVSVIGNIRAIIQRNFKNFDQLTQIQLNTVLKTLENIERNATKTQSRQKSKTNS